MFVYVHDEQLDLIFKTLGDATRRRILDLLQERSERSLFEICASFAVADGKSLSRQTISQHLDMLERAGLIITSWKGRTTLPSNPSRTRSSKTVFPQRHFGSRI